MASKARVWKSDINLGHSQPLASEIKIEQLKPVRDIVIIQKLPDQTKSDGGIHFVKGDEQECMWGKIIAIGPGCVDIMGKRLNTTNEFKIGDTVVYSSFANEKIHLGFTDYKAILVKDIIAVIE